jgi:phenylacetate-CoA ligase
MDPVIGDLTDRERHPLLTFTGRRTLEQLLEAEDAPRWNHRCGDRLDAAGLAAVRTFAAQLGPVGQARRPGERPPWLGQLVDRLRRVVPRYRAADAAGPAFTSSRDDLARAWWQLVPDDVDLDDLIWFPTSGTGGRPVVVPTHPVTVSSYYPLLLEAARWHGVHVAFRADRADWFTVVSQANGGFTVPSWSSVLGCATAQVNLHPGSWSDPADRRRFLERHDPQVITGDPLSLAELAAGDADLHPAVLISTAMTLAPATAAVLSERFRCPVVDVYSTTETGPIAAALPAGGLGLLQPRLFVEIVGADGAPVPDGERGVVTATGGMNPYLPLLRYRTGDTARLEWRGNLPVLTGFSGRAIVVVRTADGGQVSSFELTQVFERLPLRRWSVRQRADGAVTIGVHPEVGAGADIDERVAAAVRAVLGPLPLSCTPLLPDDGGKLVPFEVEPRADGAPA